jgi:hypothetical protein
MSLLHYNMMAWNCFLLLALVATISPACAASRRLSRPNQVVRAGFYNVSNPGDSIIDGSIPDDQDCKL